MAVTTYETAEIVMSTENPETRKAALALVNGWNKFRPEAQFPMTPEFTTEFCERMQAAGLKPAVQAAEAVGMIKRHWYPDMEPATPAEITEMFTATKEASGMQLVRAIRREFLATRNYAGPIHVRAWADAIRLQRERTAAGHFYSSLKECAMHASMHCGRGTSAIRTLHIG